jgi:post-segregation antitoxin (ccd killing protein)
VPEVSVYLPDELYRAAQERKLPLSALVQEAVERALRKAELKERVERMRARPRLCDIELDTAAVLDEVREEFGHMNVRIPPAAPSRPPREG